MTPQKPGETETRLLPLPALVPTPSPPLCPHPWLRERIGMAWGPSQGGRLGPRLLGEGGVTAMPHSGLLTGASLGFSPSTTFP